MATKDEESWSTIDPANGAEQDTVEFEIEEVAAPLEKEVVQLSKDVEVERVKQKAPQQELDTGKPVELEGIETRGAEKRIRQLIKQRKEREEEAAQLRTKVEELENAVKTRDRDLSSSLQNNISTTEEQLALRIKSAKENFKAAAENGDSDKLLEAQEEISKSYAESIVIRQQKEAWEKYNQQVETAKQSYNVQQGKAKVEPEFDPKAVQWATRNDWFGQDNVLTNAALAIDNELKSEGYDPTDDDFYEEIDNRLRTKYPQRFTKQEEAEDDVPAPQYRQQKAPSQSSTQVVAGASRTPKTSSNSKKVKLTQEDVRLAQKWGISLEQFATEKLKVEQADGEYSTVS
tara:strand:- start:4276 stop:5313 length:1038 start_codon:yes stop_codon:yes gene_type:complete